MKKKLVAGLMSATMAMTLLAGCGSTAEAPAADAPAAEEAAPAAEETPAAEEAAEEITDYGTGDIKVWVAENTVEFTQNKIKEWQDANPQFAGYTVTVEPVGEGDAAGNMITDVEAGADIYAFAQDQIARLVTAGALEEVAPENQDAVKSQNDEGSVEAATVGGVLYAYPLTSDNGYFLYYDKSVVTDPTSLEKIVADCEAAGKNFYFEINSAWYQTAFFFGTGAELTYDTDADGNFTNCNVTYASPEGVVALKEMIELSESKAFQNGSSVDKATDLGAIVDGTWDKAAAKAAFGDNYACAKLPEFEGADGKTYQLSGFGGYKLLGVKPQEDELKLAVCDALAAYLSGEEVQKARFEDENIGWGPSNKNVQASDAVKSDEALTALAEQLQYSIPQGQYPGDYWSLGTSLGDSIIAKEVTSSSSDDELMKVLQDFQDTCISYAK